MVFRLFQAEGTHPEAAYGRQIIGAGPSYQERQRVWLHCMECGDEMALRSLAVHLKTKNGKEASGRRHWKTMPPGGDTRTYRTAFPTAGGLWNCPVVGCPGWAATRTTMRVHIFHQHVWDTIITLEEGNLTHPQLP